MFECAAKILEEVNRDLYEIVISGKYLSYRMVRKFVVDYLQLDDFAVTCYAAMQSPLDDIFYQAKDSEDWLLLNANMQFLKIENPERYQHQLRRLINNIVASGSAAWKMMEEESYLAKSWVGATHAAYYRVMKEEGSAQFRYWLSENKHDQKKILTFFNF